MKGIVDEFGNTLGTGHKGRLSKNTGAFYLAVHEPWGRQRVEVELTKEDAIALIAEFRKEFNISLPVLGGGV